MKKLKNNIVQDPMKRRATLMLIATVVSNFFAFLYNAYLGRSINISDFALISVIGSIFGLTDILIGSVGKTITFKSAYILGKFNKPALSFWRNTRRRAFIISLFLSVIWILLSPLIASFFKINNVIPILAFTPIWIASILTSIDGGYLTGNLRFGVMAMAIIAESLSRFVSAVVLVQLNLGAYAYFALPISSVLCLAVVMFGVRKMSGKKMERVKKEEKTFPFRYYFSSVMTKISVTSYLTFDVILAKHFLTSVEAGQYALLALAGKTVFLSGSFFAQFILPIVSHKEGNGSNSKDAFHSLLLATFISSTAAFLFIGLFGYFTMPLLFGANAIQIVPLIPMYALSMVAFTVSSSIVQFYQIKNKQLLPAISLVIAVLQIIGISFAHSGLAQISSVMVLLGFISLAITLSLHLLYQRINTIADNTKDFLELFSPARRQKKVTGLRILIFNWRDTKHMWAGGAEVYIHEISKRWVRSGNSVTLFCGNDQTNLRNETIDGVRIIRRGGFYTVYFWAFAYYILKFRSNFDVIVDSENGIPFFSPLFSEKPVILLMHHVHQEIFIEHMQFPLSYLGKFIEGKVMPWVYRGHAIVTVSESSKQEIIKAGIGKKENISIINPGIEFPKHLSPKTKFPSIIYLGRLKPYKNIDIAIRAFSNVVEKVKKARLLIVGYGESEGDLHDLTIKLGLSDKVSFYGRVSEEEKIKLLSQSWVAVQPSQTEGWGITVIEANACKTSVIASNTNGLKDSIIDGTTGKLVKVRDTKGFSKELRKIILYKNKREAISKNAYNWAKNFSWDKSAQDFYALAHNEVLNRRPIIIVARQYLFNRFTSLF